MLLIWSLPIETDAMGRLFFTPQMRLSLERTKKKMNVNQRRTGSGSKATATLTVNGWVTAGHRKRVWFDGRMLKEGETRIHPILSADSLRLRWYGRRLELKPGQTVQRDPSGKIRVLEFSSD